jgi:hypothetical protein
MILKHKIYLITNVQGIVPYSMWHVGSLDKLIAILEVKDLARSRHTWWAACLAYSFLDDEDESSTFFQNNSNFYQTSQWQFSEVTVDCYHHENPKSFFFFLLERPNLFAICNNTFSKWWYGWRMSCRRVLSSTPLLVRGSETGGDSGE